MSQSVVVFDSVWKKFRTGEGHNSLRDLIPSLARRAFHRVRSEELRDREFWALKDVSFEVKPGEALGIIGPNGAGKSTALKLLTRILKPTRGRAEVRGRTGALIEVAAGFHPDLTGRENVYLQGAILGMKRAEIARKFDEIVSFTGMAADFIETPVKRYSSGMNARLGFAIAAHVSPDVLIVDEVLSVGDMDFQRRCSERMIALKHEGVAIVVVSHNLSAIRGLCERTLLLRKGAVDHLGPTDVTLERYIALAAPKPGEVGPAAGPLQVRSVEIPPGRDSMRLHPGDVVTVRLRAAREKIPAECILVTVITEHQTGVIAYCSNRRVTLEDRRHDADRVDLVIELALYLARGTYRLGFGLLDPSTQTHTWANRGIVVGVDEMLSLTGIAHIPTTITIEPVDASVPLAAGAEVPSVR